MVNRFGKNIIRKWVLEKDWGHWLNDDIHENPQNLMYLAELEDLRIYLDEEKEEFKHSNSVSDRKIIRTQIKDYEEQIKDLEEFVVNYERLQERYKHDEKMLKQIRQDWEEYNLELFGRWNHVQALIIGGNDDSTQEERRLQYKKYRAKLNEIELKFKRLLE